VHGLASGQSEEARVRLERTAPPERCRKLAGELLRIEGIDSVAIRAPEAGAAELWSSDGVAEVGWTDGGLYQRGKLFREELEAATPSEALASSADEKWPDAAFALASLFPSWREGDLLVSAAEGYDLRTTREWPEHHASHGALHRAHTVVPLWSTAPLPPGPLRTLDLFPYALGQAGIPLAEYPGSDAALLAAGTWAPGVLA
jgi:hypothetical protein